MWDFWDVLFGFYKMRRCRLITMLANMFVGENFAAEVVVARKGSFI